MKANYLPVFVANTALAAAFLFAVATAHAQTFTTLKSFSSETNGSTPNGGLTVSDGVLYGINGSGGISNGGTIFKLSTNGSGFSVIHYFAGGSEGLSPVGRVVVSGNTIYGVTYRGGTNFGINEGGTIYRVNTDGSNFSILRRLNKSLGDGIKPLSGLVLSGSTLCGTAGLGGVSDLGVVYKISTNGTGYQNLHSFTGAADGFQPEAELVLIGTTLFGTTFYTQFGLTGPALFKLGVDGTGFTVLYTFPITFSLSDRLTPVGSVFYGVGTSYEAGKYFSSVYKISTNGSGFQIGGQLPSDYSIHGALTWTGSGSLVAACWNSLGSFDQLFQINTNGTGYHVLKTFGAAGTTEPSLPVGDLALSGTTVYGGTGYGGEFNNGTMFSFDLRPRLAITATGAALNISWPSYAHDYQLEQSPALTASWTNVIAAPSDDGTNRTITLFAPAPSDPVFHRLRR